MMRRIIVLSLFLVFGIISYSDVKWSGDSGKISIIYKIVDPLIVTVEEPEKLIVSANQKTFTYSKMSSKKAPLVVKVTSSYNQNTIDEILRKIYETVYFQLQNGGKFELKNGAEQKVITGNGYFVDSQVTATEGAKLTEISKPFSSTVSGNTFSTTTGIDVDFTLPDGDVPMGIYRGTLYLNVWFGGSLN